MDLIMPQVFDRIKAASGELVRCRRYDIGPWDMDADGTIEVAWDWPDLSKIVSIEVMIKSDDGILMVPLCGLTQYATGSVRGGIGSARQTFIDLFRVTGGSFDSVNFNDTSINRGYIYVWYME